MILVLTLDSFSSDCVVDKINGACYPGVSVMSGARHTVLEAWQNCPTLFTRRVSSSQELAGHSKSCCA